MRHIILTALLAVVGLSIFPHRVAGQQPAAPPPPPPRREVNAEVSFISTTGNTSLNSLGMGGGVILRPDNWEITAKSAFVRSQTDDVVTAEAIDGLFRASRRITGRLSAVGADTYLRNRFAGIEHRNTVEGGLAYLLVDSPRHSLTMSGGIGYANEQRSVGDDLSTAIAPVGALYKFTISPTSAFTNDLRAMQSLSDSDDRRVTNVAAITATLTTRLSLKVSHTARFVNAPVADFEKLDTITGIALVTKF